jgi:hypothetical protein
MRPLRFLLRVLVRATGVPANAPFESGKAPAVHLHARHMQVADAEGGQFVSLVMVAVNAEYRQICGGE